MSQKSFLKPAFLTLIVLFTAEGVSYADNPPPNSVPPIIDTGAWLQSLCRDLVSPSNPPSGANIGICVGYVRGVIQSWYTGESQVNPSGAIQWIQDNSSLSSYDAAKLVVTYMQGNPNTATESAVDVIITAITAAHPISTTPAPPSAVSPTLPSSLSITPPVPMLTQSNVTS